MRLILTCLVILGLAFFARGVFAQTAREPQIKEVEEGTRRYQYWIQQALGKVREIEPRCAGCDLFAAGKEGETELPACRHMYRDLYHVKDRVEDERPEDTVIDMRVAFGYMDLLSNVEDRYAETAFLAELTGTCRAGEFACGFKQDDDDPEFLTKQIKITGPDGKPRLRWVQLQLRASSASSSEQKNRGDGKDQQTRKTEETRAFFEEGLRESDLLLYVGHARDGGGPDFAPPVVNPKTHRTDFNWYHQHTIGVDRMRGALAGAKKTPRVLGIFACYAEDHFLDFLKKSAPKSGLVLAGKSEFETITSQAMATIDSTLAMRCEPQFSASVNTLKKGSVEEITPVRVENLFRKP